MSRIDWTRPWLTHLHSAARRIDPDEQYLEQLNALALHGGLKNNCELPIRFVPQAVLPAGMAYETFIYRTGLVPTRINHHDFFNGLIWLTFPKIKARLNALQAAEIQRRTEMAKEGESQGTGRGRLRDAITVFDENAVLFAYSDDSICKALREHHWSEVFERRRGEYGVSWTALTFGHALIEKLANPYKAITAHACPVLVEKAFFSLTVHEQVSELDQRIGHALSASLATSDFFPLPVLGIPGWWHDQDSEFYRDVQVFRPKRYKAEASGDI